MELDVWVGLRAFSLLKRHVELMDYVIVKRRFKRFVGKGSYMEQLSHIYIYC